jgi:hypothetical protein
MDSVKVQVPKLNVRYLPLYVSGNTDPRWLIAKHEAWMYLKDYWLRSKTQQA